MSVRLSFGDFQMPNGGTFMEKHGEGFLPHGHADRSSYLGFRSHLVLLYSFLFLIIFKFLVLEFFFVYVI